MKLIIRFLLGRKVPERPLVCDGGHRRNYLTRGEVWLIKMRGYTWTRCRRCKRLMRLGPAEAGETR